MSAFHHPTPRYCLATAPDALGRPEAWADRRATLVRWLIRLAEPGAA